jgi:hypothetical protein
MNLIKRSLQISLAAAGLVFISSGCAKVEGPGGSSSIVGKIHVVVKDVGGNIINEYDAQNEDVFLLYGDEDTFYDDDTKTSYDGSFAFNYLQKGSYTLFVYQDCATCNSGKEPVFVDIEITDSKTEVNAGTITIIQ